MQRFIEANRNQPLLLPPDLNDWLPDDHLARYLVTIVDRLDLGAIYEQYGGKGGKEAHHPKILLLLLFYGYATGVFSSRKIERATYDSVAFRFLSADTHPDHDTISTFRRRFLPQLEEIFVQILFIARQTGLLRVGNVSLDGTKVKANASKHKALSYAHALKLQAQYEEEVQRLMGLAEAADSETTPDGLSIPEEIARRQDRIKQIEEAKAQIEAMAKERYERQKAECDAKMQAREARAKAIGKKPKAPEEGPTPKDQINLTDEESRIMPVSGGGFEQAYNAQAGVEETSHLIVYNSLSQQANDKQQIRPALRWFKDHPHYRPLVLVGDTGYYSEANVNACIEHGIDPLLSPNRERHNLPIARRLSSALPPSQDATMAERMHYHIRQDGNKEIYAKRKSTVEPVFGIIKQIMGFRQFLLRGLEKVKGEWNLVCIAYNLKRMHKMAIG